MAANPLRTRSLRIGATLLVLGVLAAFGHWCATADFGNNGLVTNLCHFGEIYAQSWDDLGFLEACGVPMAHTVGLRVIDRAPYAHMPPAGWWPPYFGRCIWGKTNHGFKLFPVLFAVLGALLVFLLVQGHAGPGWGLLSVLAYVTVPGVRLYAALPGVESLSFFAAALFLVVWEWARRRPSRAATRTAYCVFLLGCLTAWPFYFVAGGLLLAEVLLPRGERAWHKVLMLFPLGALGVGLVILHLTIGTGDLGYVLDDFLKTARNVSQDGLAGDPALIGNRASFLASIPGMARENLGPAGGWALVASLLGCLLIPTWRRDPVTRLLVIFLVQGVCNVVLFNGRSSTHGYYYFLMGASMALALTQGARMVAALLRRWMPPVAATGAAVLLVAAVQTWGLLNVHDLLEAMERPGLRELAAAIDQQIPPDTWVYCHPNELHGTILFSERRWVPPFPVVAHLRDILERKDRGELPFRQLVVVLDQATAAAHPDYARHVEGLLATRPGSRKVPFGNSVVYFL